MAALITLVPGGVATGAATACPATRFLDLQGALGLMTQFYVPDQGFILALCHSSASQTHSAHQIWPCATIQLTGPDELGTTDLTNRQFTELACIVSSRQQVGGCIVFCLHPHVNSSACLGCVIKNS